MVVDIEAVAAAVAVEQAGTSADATSETAGCPTAAVVASLTAD